MKTLFENITVITMDDDAGVINNGYVAVDKNKIKYVGTSRPEGKFDRVIKGENKALIPGLINAHTHTAMTLLRGYADDMNLQDWLYNKIFPFEDKMTPEDVRRGSEIAIDEMLAGGTTCFSDMYFFQAETGRAAVQKGIRAVLSDCVSFDGYDRKVKLMEEMAEEFKDCGLITFTFSPHAIYTCSFELLEKCAAYAKEHNLPIHTHLAETRTEFSDCEIEHNMTPTAYMESAGLFENPTIAAHCVVMTDSDLEILKRHNVSVAHNPMSNLKLASGIAPVPKMLDMGINVALGTDGASSNNSLDMFEEIKAAALIHKGAGLDPTAVPAETALKMATVNGARALGFDDLGMIKEGYLADLVVVDLDTPHLKPLYDPISSLVYSAKCGDVEYTMVNGNIVYER